MSVSAEQELKQILRTIGKVQTCTLTAVEGYTRGRKILDADKRNTAIVLGMKDAGLHGCGHEVVKRETAKCSRAFLTCQEGPDREVIKCRGC